MQLGTNVKNRVLLAVLTAAIYFVGMVMSKGGFNQENMMKAIFPTAVFTIIMSVVFPFLSKKLLKRKAAKSEKRSCLNS